jgi:hypothetical protein
MHRRLSRFIAATLLGLLLAVPAAMAQQGRTTVAVGTVTLSPSASAAVPAGFRETLRSEIQVALEGTGLFSVPGANEHEIDAMLDELARSGRAAPRTSGAQYIYAVRVETLTLSEEMRVAPQLTTHDLVTTRGAIVVQISALSPATGNVVRFIIDGAYQAGPAMRDSLSTRNNRDVNRGALVRAASDPQAYRALAHNAASRLAGRILENNNAVQVVDVDGDRIFINRGDDAGYAIGDTLTVRSLGRELRDPVTGERLGDTGAEIGRIRLTEIRARVSVGVIEQGAGAIAVGAIVRRPQAAQP